MAAGSVFPAFIRAEYDPSGGGFARFEQSARASAARARQHFEGSFDEIKRLARDALTMPRNAGGSLDINVGQYRQAAEGARAHSVALREVATAAERAARSNRDTSEETRLYVQAARAAAIEAEGVARSTAQQATAMDRLQSELNQTRSGTQAVIAGNRGLTQSQDAYANSARASRFAMVQVGQQLQDVAIQAQMGVSPMQILVQQGSQLGFAMSQMTGRARVFGNFIAGPWGTAIMLGVAAAGFLADALRRSRDAAKDLEEALKRNQESTQLLGEAQSSLGQLFDLSTGKIRDNSDALRENVRWQLESLKLQAEQLGQDAGQRLGGMRTRPSDTQWGAAPTRTPGEPQLPVLRSGPRSRQQEESWRRFVDWYRQNGQASPSEARRWLEQNRANLPGIDIHEAIGEIINIANARRAAQRAQRGLNSIEQGVLDPEFRTGRGNRGNDRSREIESLREFGRDAADRLTGVAGDFADTPRVLDRARDALRGVDDLYGDIITKNERLRELTGQGFENFDELRRSADQARSAIREGVVRQLTEDFREQPRLVQRVTEALQGLEEAQREFGAGNEQLMQRIRDGAQLAMDALNRPYREFLEDQLRAFEVQRLIGQGREEEAEALQIIHRLEEQTGTLSEERRQTILDSVVGLRQQARELEVIRERQQLYLRAVDDIRGSITDLLSNPQSGFRGVADFASSLVDNFNRLRGEDLAQRLFGGVFRAMEDRVTGRDQLRRANEQAASSMGSVAQAADEVRAAQDDQIPAIDAATAAFRRLTEGVDAAAQRMSEASASILEPASETVAGSALRGDAAALRILNPLRDMIVGGDSHAQHRRRGSHGVDLRAGIGTSVYAPFEGTVSTSTSPRGGLQAFITSLDRRIVQGFAHLNAVIAPAGTRVRAGQLVARSGNTGGVDPHLHSSLRVDGRAVDPMRYYGRRLALPGVTEAVAAAQGPMTDLAETLNGIGEGARETVQRLGEASAGFSEWLTGLSNDLEQAAAEETPTVVTAPKTRDPNALNPRRLMGETVGNLLNRLGVSKNLAKDIGQNVALAIEGASQGRMVSGMILGRGGSTLGSSLGGAVGNIAGKALASSLPKALGQFAGPIGSAVGGLIGGVLPGLIGSKPRASSTIGGAGGRLVVASTTGSSRYRDQTSGAADSAISSVERIAEMLGGTLLAGVGAVSIGIRNGKYRVDPSGKGNTKTKKGAIDFGEDAEAAVLAATLDLIKDGVIGGLKASTQRLLQSAKDLDAGIDKALKFESVFVRLKEHLDPLGAGLDVLDREFGNLRRIFQEAGASAEEYAQLEQLYGLERKRVLEETTRAMTSTLRDLLDDLTVNNDALSLRDRLTMAKGKYDPLAADIAAGKKVDYEQFAEAARTVLDIQRQLSGSQSPYFDLLAEVTGLTRRALSDQENIISIGTGRATPFGPATGPATNDNTPVVGAVRDHGDLLVRELGGRLDALNTNVGRLVAGGGGGGGGGSRFADFEPRVNF